MAIINPLRAWRFALDSPNDIKHLTCPLFDVTSSEELQKLYNNPYNSIHLSQPKGDHPFINAGKTLVKWKEDGVIKQDYLPGLYVYYQYFRLPNDKQSYCRKGFICMIDMLDQETDYARATKDIQIHESTIPKAVEARKELLENTLLNISPTHGLYHDDKMALDKYMDEAIADPIYTHTDYQGVQNVISVIHDKKVINEFMEHLKDKQVVLADGHHRYKASVDYMEQCNNPSSGNKYHMIYLTNSAAHDFQILPTHRLISKKLESFQNISERASKYFEITPIDNPKDVQGAIQGQKHSFGVLVKDNAYQFRLKDNSALNDELPDAIKSLDVVILHNLLMGNVLDIPDNEQRDADFVTFNSNIDHCFHQVERGKVSMAIILNPISPEDVYSVGRSGTIMPQKTTYFYPKVVCGYLFGSIQNNEINSSTDSCF